MLVTLLAVVSDQRLALRSPHGSSAQEKLFAQILELKDPIEDLHTYELVS